MRRVCHTDLTLELSEKKNLIQLSSHISYPSEISMKQDMASVNYFLISYLFYLK